MNAFLCDKQCGRCFKQLTAPAFTNKVSQFWEIKVFFQKECLFQSTHGNRNDRFGSVCKPCSAVKSARALISHLSGIQNRHSQKDSYVLK